MLRGRREGPGGSLAAGLLAGLVAAALAVGWLVLRGPGAWATGSGQFGLDVMAITVVLVAAAAAVAHRAAGGVRGAA